MRKTLSAFIFVLAVVALSACTPEYRPEAHGEGETLAHNFLLQAVNPRPNETTVPPDMDGKRAADAYERYRNGKVIIPKRVETTDFGSGSK